MIIAMAPMSKGGKRFSIRLPRTHKEMYEQLVAREGLPMSDYVAAVLALAHGLDTPAFVRPNRPQDEELPLEQTACKS